MNHPILDALYLLCCVVAFAAAFHLQMFRHRESKSCVWYAYTALMIGIGWEAFDAYLFGPPDFPSSRWVLLPSLAIIQAAAALKDRFGHKKEERA